ncbi:hypothetical protein DRO97_02515 [Archaeoglobales archaeon]|nr:MAG: hypothetical protein DRO97_02515 [Archaeoglobales archaeon]
MKEKAIMRAITIEPSIWNEFGKVAEELNMKKSEILRILMIQFIKAVRATEEVEENVEEMEVET